MSTPPADLPEWNVSESNVSEPATARKTTGWAAGEIPAAGHINWLFNLIYKWIVYLYARVQGYTTLQGFYAGVTDGSSAPLAEIAEVPIGEEIAFQVDGTALPAFVSGNGPFLVVATTSGEPRVIARTTAAQVSGAATLFTLTRNTAATNYSIRCRGDRCVVASGNRVDMFVISTGVRLWSYNHGAQVYDADIYGTVVGMVGAASGGNRIVTINAVSGSAVSLVAGALAMIGIAAMPDGRWAIQYAGGVSLYLSDLSAATWAAVSADLGNTVHAITTDGRGVYVGSDTGMVTKLNLAAGAVEWQVTPLATAPNIIGLTCDHGGVYPIANDGAGDVYAAKLDKLGGGVMGITTFGGNNPLSVHADGSGWFVGVDHTSRGLSSYGRGNRAGMWLRVSANQGRYLTYPWLTQPVGEE